MALDLKLGFRLSQRLVMTPSLQQAIKMLQMSKLELVEEVQQELLENPVLEEGQAEGEAETADAEEERKDPLDEIDFEAYFHDIEGYRPRPTPEAGFELPTFESTRDLSGLFRSAPGSA